MKSRTGILIFLTFFFGGMCWGVLPDNLSALWNSSTPVSQQDPSETKEQISDELSTFARLAQELKPAVVNKIGRAHV